MKSGFFALLVTLILLNLLSPRLTFAKDSPISKEKSGTSAFDLPHDPSRPRSFIWPPLFSFLLPGFDQWIENQYGYAAAYSGVAAGGIGLVGADTSFASYKADPFAREAPRLAVLGLLLYQTSGSLSAYHSFRTATKSRHALGDFLFLTHEESPTDLLLSPFHFDYVTRPTTYLAIPIHLGIVILLEKLQGNEPFGPNWRTPDASDMFYSGAFSLNAGIGEEALFRGYSMPVYMHYLHNEFLSNAIVALIFGALHWKKGHIPISQTLAGFYFGYLTQKNEWQLGESIFIHTWYDIIAFLLNYANSDSIARSKLAFQISPISITF